MSTLIISLLSSSSKITSVNLSIDVSLSAHIFRTLKFVKKGNLYTLGPRRLSYTRCR